MRNIIMLKTSDKEFSEIVQKSMSYAEICRILGLRIQGSNYNTIKKRIYRQNLSISHFNPHIGAINKNKIPIKDLLKENVNYGSNLLKKRLIKEKLLENKCNKCGLIDTWQNKPITLQLDHINGNHKDNRLENLQILCPNCHSQTNTHSGKRFKLNFTCQKCGKNITNHAKLCKKCNGNEQAKNNPILQVKIDWPSIEILTQWVWEKPTIVISKELNTSHNGLIRHCKKLQINLPPKGYWQRRNAGYSHEESLISQAKIRKNKELLSDNIIKEIRLLFSTGYGCREIGRLLGICHTKISAITRNKSYRHVI